MGKVIIKFDNKTYGNLRELIINAAAAAQSSFLSKLLMSSANQINFNKILLRNVINLTQDERRRLKFLLFFPLLKKNKN
jgi:hypothetical protein